MFHWKQNLKHLNNFAFFFIKSRELPVKPRDVSECVTSVIELRMTRDRENIYNIDRM